MNRRRILLALLITGMMTTVASAQSQEKRRGWALSKELINRTTGTQPQKQSTRSEDQFSDAGRDDEVVDKDSQGQRDLTGSWLGTVTYNEFDYSSKFLSTLCKNGTFTASSEGDIVLDFGVANSAQHGAWTKKGHDDFALKYLLLVSDSQTGVLVATIRIRIRIELLSKNRWRGRFTQDEIYPDGTVLNNTASGTIEARRIRDLQEIEETGSGP